MNLSRGFAPLILFAIVGLIVLGGAGWLVTKYAVNQEGNVDTIATESSDSTPPKIPSSWKFYSNAEIGISFYYPPSWGELKTVRGRACQLDVYYYGEDKVAQIKQDLAANPDDPCEEVSITTSDDSLNEGPIVYTKSVLNSKYPIPRGGFWGDLSSGITSDEFVQNLCSKWSLPSGCVTYRNSNDFLIGKRLESDGEGYEGPGVPVYFVHTKSKIFPGIVMSPSRLLPGLQTDFEVMVNSLSLAK